MQPKIILFLFLFILLSVRPAFAKEAYWEQDKIELAGLNEQQVLILESTIAQLQSLKADKLKIGKKSYRRLSHFKELFGFAFDGPELSRWLLKRIRSISYQNTWTAAVNQHQGDFFVGDIFFTQLSPLEKLYALIHEARHSDDDGYEHVKCPKAYKYVSARQPDLDLENLAACDAVVNGAYAFQAAFLFELFAYGIFEQHETGLLYNSSISRMIP